MKRVMGVNELSFWLSCRERVLDSKGDSSLAGLFLSRGAFSGTLVM